MKNFIKIAFILAFLVISCPVFSTEYYVVYNLDKIFKQTRPEQSNATCFFYHGNKYKCICNECNNLKIWTSGDITNIKGFSVDRIYGIIEDCK